MSIDDYLNEVRDKAATVKAESLSMALTPGPYRPSTEYGTHTATLVIKDAPRLVAALQAALKWGDEHAARACGSSIRRTITEALEADDA